MTRIKFYEQGKVAGDFMGVLGNIERNNETAIVHDHTGFGNLRDPEDPNWQVFIDGEMFAAYDSSQEAQQGLQRELDRRRK